MGGAIFIFFYGSILFFFIATALRVRECVRSPIHLHWELYQGSSIYETMDWWTKPPKPFNEKLLSMVLDILFLKEFYLRNKKFWYVLYTFHVGLYLLIVWHLWLFISALTTNIETASNLGWIGGIFSSALTFIGGMGILLMRIKDEELKLYYPPIHYIKWIFILLTVLGGVYAVDVHFKSSMPTLLKYVREQITFVSFEHKLHPSLGPALHIGFASVWLIYLPFSHVFQLFFRYYHSLRWDDVPNVKGGEIEKRVKGYLERPVSWAAPHIPSDKSWKEVASEFTQHPRTGTY